MSNKKLYLFSEKCHLALIPQGDLNLQGQTLNFVHTSLFLFFILFFRTPLAYLNREHEKKGTHEPVGSAAATEQTFFFEGRVIEA